MICPRCGHVNLPGSDDCERCLFDLAPLDLPTAQNRVENSIMFDPIWTLKPKAPKTLPEYATLGMALQTMVDAEMGAVLIVNDQQKLIGILTERDFLLKVVGNHEDFAQLPIRDFMTTNPETVNSVDRLAYALQRMDVGGYRHLPVVDEGIPVGMLSIRDVIKHITRLCKEG